MNSNAVHEASISAADSRPWAIKLATASASLSMLAAAPQGAQAAIIKVTGSPITASLGSNSDNFWDIDSNGIAESNFKAIATGNNTTFNRTINWLFSNGMEIIRNRFLTFYQEAYASNLAALPESFNVGPTLPASKPWGYPATGKQLVMRASSQPDSGGRRGVVAWNGYLTEFNFQPQPNYFGFRFKIDGQTHYGYGLLEIKLGDTGDKLDSKTVTLTSWAYNTVPDQPIHVEAISENVPAPIGLAGLAAGAAWTRKLRRRIRESA